jgi:hypothetical protein
VVEDRSVTQPAISIVVAAWAGEARLTACLESLRPQSQAAEVIVATNLAPEICRGLESTHPGVRFVCAGSAATVPRMRAVGAQLAQGQLIALIEDHCSVGPQWRDALCRAHAQGHQVLGGPVDNGRVQSAYDWALFFCEYGFHMFPAPDGYADAVSGVNVAYARDALMRHPEIWRELLHENEVNDALGAEGHRPYVASEAWVVSHLPMRLGEAMTHLYQGGRHYARYRASGSSWRVRGLRAVTSPAIPAVLFARIFRRVASRNAERLRPLARSIGYCLLLLGSWSVGEAVGYLRCGERSASAR